jgi:hypothetical protein
MDPVPPPRGIDLVLGGVGAYRQARGSILV